MITAAGDPRIPLVPEAVDYWNQQFAEMGTTFRFGEVSQVEGSVPADDVSTLASSWRPELPASLQQYTGDVLVVLSDASFISRTAPRGERVVIAIKTHEDPRMTTNIMRNVIAHELGHALGLDHNSDPTFLMCGRPAPCRPGIYRSEHPLLCPLRRRESAPADHVSYGLANALPRRTERPNPSYDQRTKQRPTGCHRAGRSLRGLVGLSVPCG